MERTVVNSIILRATPRTEGLRRHQWRSRHSPSWPQRRPPPRATAARTSKRCEKLFVLIFPAKERHEWSRKVQEERVNARERMEHLRPYSQRVCDVAHTVKFYCECDVAKSLRMGPLDDRNRPRRRDKSFRRSICSTFRGNQARKLRS